MGLVYTTIRAPQLALFSERLTEILGWSTPCIYLVAEIFIEAIGVQATRARAEESRTPAMMPNPLSAVAHNARPPTTKPTDLTAREPANMR